MSAVTIAAEQSLVQRFAELFARELELLDSQSVCGGATGEQISEVMFDILRIDMRLGDDYQAFIAGLPLEIKNFIRHAYDNRSYRFQPLSRHIGTIRRVGGVT
ncbi:TPA: hypothetical protein DCF80_04300 [Candidatus Saccharibacteria bacterium]|nr:hypothetical protein [Candidatus Saccharibacteria bacterium]